MIDDHSRDATAQAATAAGARVVRPPRHIGLAGCLLTGYQMALKEDFETVVRVDGDGQHEAADIPILLRAMRETGADVVIGSRFLSPRPWKTSAVRSVGIAVLRKLLAPALGQTIHDPTSGFIAVNRRALEFLANSSTAYPEAGALVALRRQGFQIHEVACRMHPRHAGRSSMTFLTSVAYACRILARLPRRSESRREAAEPARAGSTIDKTPTVQESSANPVIVPTHSD